MNGQQGGANLIWDALVGWNLAAAYMCDWFTRRGREKASAGRRIFGTPLQVERSYGTIGAF